MPPCKASATFTGSDAILFCTDKFSRADMLPRVNQLLLLAPPISSCF